MVKSRWSKNAINAVYAADGKGCINIGRKLINKLYKHAQGYEQDCDFTERTLKNITKIEALLDEIMPEIFEGNYDKAQLSIDKYEGDKK